MSREPALRRHGSELVPNRLAASIRDQFLSSSSSFSALCRSFSTPLPSFSSTSVLPFSRSVPLRSRYVSAIGLVVAFGLNFDRIVRRVCPERWLTLGDPARTDDEKDSYRKFPQAAVFTYGAPRQPPLPVYPAYAHPSFRPQQRPL